MKNYFRYSFILVVIASVLASCSVSNFSIEKRKYRKGFYTNTSDSRAKGKVAAETAKAENNEAAISNEEAVTAFNSTIEVPQAIEAAPSAKESFTVTPSEYVVSQLERGFVTTEKSSNGLSRIETKILKKAVKSAQKKSPFDAPDKVLLVILAIIIPPLAVYLHQGEVNGKFWLNILLTLLCGLPGVIHALIVVLRD